MGSFYYGSTRISVCKINVFVFSTIQRVKQTVCQALSKRSDIPAAPLI